MSATLGVEPEQLTVMARTWRQEGDEVGALAWSTLSEATGEGSEVLTAVRALAEPAERAMSSIADRYATLADLVDRFAADIHAKDAQIAGEIDKLSDR
ncbi:hypothetical protein [Nocardia mangyaensis]|uniref:hypothetical protein n=1 Tax=Nocardia mangyaensis TaxID=2213200 RepID=UPI00267498F4|nr:hypothetical protein [Nocardia mangyaensis]MDO3648571.1 hypothetical protein [Nocardia mangyaensis]